jgi:tetratricopeptide (TPR) repeat protein
MSSTDKYAIRIAALIKDGTAIALVMALVAMFGAIAALRAGNAEEEADVLESKLSQRHLIELTLRKEYNEREGQLFHFDDEYFALVTEGRRLRAEADALRQVDPAGASRRDVQAEVEFNAARIMRPYRNSTWIDGYEVADRKPAQTIDRNVSRDLQSIGLGSQWVDTKDPKNEGNQDTSLWRTLHEEIDRIQGKLIRLTIAVVLFVAALGCLTFAELWRHNLFRMGIMVALGTVVTLAGLILAVISDPISGLFFVAVIFLFGVFGYVGVLVAPYISGFAKTVAVRMGFLDPNEKKETAEEKEEEETPHPGEVEPRLFPGVRVHAEHSKRAFSILVVLLIVFTVLVSAAIGTAYSVASTSASKEASDAADLLVKGFRDSDTSRAYSLLSKLATTQEDRLRFQAVLQEDNLAEMGVLKNNPEKMDEEKARWGTAVNNERNDLIEFLTDKNTNGPGSDTRYPRAFLNALPKEGSHNAFALADAENELSLAYHTRAEQFLTMLTWLAIALYLFGQSLTMTQDLDAASMLVVFGVFLVTIVIGFAVVQSSRRITGKVITEADSCRAPNQKAEQVKANEAAARHYTNGRMRYDTANTQEEYRAAADEFECAAAARPTFSLANYYLARASQHAKSPQNGESFTSLFSEDGLSKVVDREDQAINGFDRESATLNADLMGNLGWDTYSLGLVEKKRGLLQKGLKETRKAVDDDGNKELPFVRFNLGVTELAVGDFPAATAAYKEALAATPVASLQDGLALANVNDLEVLLHYCAGVRSADDCKKIEGMAEDFKQQMVAAAWPVPSSASNSSAAPPRLRDLWLIATPAGLGWHAKLENFSEGRDVLTVIWYKWEDKWQLWRALPDLSGQVDFNNTKRDAAGELREFRSYLDATGQQTCAESSPYRAEFYLNGKRQDLQPPPKVTMKFPPFKSGIFRDLNVSVCHPEDWGVRWHPGKVNQFMAGGYVDEAGSKGVFAFEYYFPRVNLNEAVKKDFALLSLKYLANGKVQFHVAENEQNTCPIHPVGQTVLRMKSDEDSFRALVRVWDSPEGIVHVGIAMHKTQPGDFASGKDDLGAASDECNALSSMHEISSPY